MEHSRTYRRIRYVIYLFEIVSYYDRYILRSARVSESTSRGYVTRSSRENSQRRRCTP